MFNFEDGSLVLCGANSKQHNGVSCRQPAMKNGRCRLHGGWCTGPKTNEGRLRVKLAHTKHGFYSTEAIAERKQLHEMIRSMATNVQLL